MVFQNDPYVKWQLRANYNEMLRDEISIQHRVTTETSMLISCRAYGGRKGKVGNTGATLRGGAGASPWGRWRLPGWSSGESALNGKCDSFYEG